MANLGSGGLQTASSMFNSFIPELWTQGVRYYFQKKLILGALATDWSSVVANGGDTVHIPRINEQAAAAKAQHSAGAISWTNNTTDESKDTLNITNHHYSALLIEDVARIQANDDLMAKYTLELGYALAKKIEVTTEKMMQDDSTNAFEFDATADVGDGGTFGKYTLAKVITGLSESDVDYLDGQVSIVLNPTIYGDLFKTDDFVRHDVIGDKVNDFSRISGYVGKLAGMPVYMSNVVGTANAATKGYVFHKSFSNIAFSQMPRLQDQYDIDYLGTKVVTDAIYGVKGKDSATAGERRCWRLISA